MNKKTIGIIGTGKHFDEKIYPILLKSNFFKISGALRKKRSNFKNIKILKERDFFKKKFDFVYISCPNKFHENYIIKSLRSGSHVICEKPFIVRKKNMKKIIQLAKRNKKLIFEAFMYLYHPAYKYVEKLFRDQTYGKFRYLISNFRYPALNRKNNRYKKGEGDGFFNDAATYPLSLENYIFKNENKKAFKLFTQKIKSNVDLRGNIFINSSKGKRFYFWGEGQNYSNNLEIFFDKASIFINKFFSKKKDEKIYVKIYTKTQKKIIIEKVDQFQKMFLTIQKNYFKESFQKFHINMIKNQLNLLLKYNS